MRSFYPTLKNIFIIGRILIPAYLVSTKGELLLSPAINHDGMDLSKELVNIKYENELFSLFFIVNDYIP